MGVAAAPVQANVTVSAEGTDSGGNPHDTLVVTGDSTQDNIVIREGFEGDVGPGGAPDTCGGNDLLCFLTVEANKPISPQGACQRDGSDTKVKCAYFHAGTAQTTHTYEGRVDMLGGVNDRVQIIQAAVFACCQALTTPWNWKLDYGPGNDVIDGPTVLNVPDQRGTVNVTIAGGAGSDLFRGPFAARPTTLFGDDDNGAANVIGSDIFRQIGFGLGMSIKAQGGDDSIRPLSTAIPIDAGPGDDLVNLAEAAFAELGPATAYDGGSGTDTLNYGRERTAPDGPPGRLGSEHRERHADELRERDRRRGQGPALRHRRAQCPEGGRRGRGRARGQGRRRHARRRRRGGGTLCRGDSADGGAGADLILANDGVRDLVSCGSSDHAQTVFVNGRAQQIFIFDADRARLDLTDTQGDCEDVEREAMRTPAAARIASAKLTGSEVLARAPLPPGSARRLPRACQRQGGRGPLPAARRRAPCRSGAASRCRAGAAPPARIRGGSGADARARQPGARQNPPANGSPTTEVSSVRYPVLSVILTAVALAAAGPAQGAVRVDSAPGLGAFLDHQPDTDGWRVIIEHFSDSSRNGFRARQIGFGDPTIFETSNQCSGNSVFNDVVCNSIPETIQMSTGAVTNAPNELAVGGSNGSCQDVAVGTGTSGGQTVVILDLRGGDDIVRPLFGCGGQENVAGNHLLAPQFLGGGGAGNDSITGGRLNDSFRGDSGNDRLSGGSGDDELVGNDGADVIDGGPGTDTVKYEGSSPVTVRLDGSANDGRSGERDNVIGTEVVIGSAANDNLTGSSGAETLDGGAGNDQIAGGNGADTLRGEDGDDLIDARDNASTDVVRCGNGSDEVIADLQDSVQILGTPAPRGVGAPASGSSASRSTTAPRRRSSPSGSPSPRPAR